MLGSIENYNTAEVAKRLGVTDQSVRNFCKRGWLKFIDVASSDSSCPIYQFTDAQINEFLCNFHYDMESGRYKPVETLDYSWDVSAAKTLKVDAEKNLKEFLEATSCDILNDELDNKSLEIRKLEEENKKLAAENDRLTALLKRERLKTREFINNAINLLIPLEED